MICKVIENDTVGTAAMWVRQSKAFILLVRDSQNERSSGHTSTGYNPR